jgi:CRISPR-associated endonuclease Cas1
MSIPLRRALVSAAAAFKVDQRRGVFCLRPGILLENAQPIALASVGFDPYRGFYHAPRYGRPALALDLMEPFRAIIADSVVLSAVNTGEVGPNDFIVAVTGTALTQAGRRRFVEAFERRLSQETTHPVFGYQVSMRRMLLVQARLLSRFLLGELPTYPHYLPR